jgi:hypothetical protein
MMEDKDGDGRLSQDDLGAQTLVELESPNRPLVSMFNAVSGSFSFTNIPAGEYVLVVWWSPGFIGGTTAPTNDGRLEIKFSVADDGSVTGAIPGVILARQSPEGLVPYPVRSGGGTEKYPVGIVDVAVAYAAAGIVELPPTGLATDPRGTNWRWPVGLVALAVAAVTFFGSGIVTRKSR